MKARKIWNFLMELVSFGSPRAIVINLSLILILALVIPPDRLYVVPSVFKGIVLPLLFGGHCPDSGFLKDCSIYSTGQTRALSRLMHGDLEGAWGFNKLVFIVFFVIIFLIVLNLTKIVRNKSNRRANDL